MRFELVTVSPQKASTWLLRNKNVRPLRQEYVALVASDMKAGRYVFDGATIKFDKDGNLIDGQHRLSAIVASGVSVLLLVVHGADAHAALDSGRQRQLSQYLQHENSDTPYWCGVCAQALVKLVLSYERYGNPVQHYTRNTRIRYSANECDARYRTGSDIPNAMESMLSVSRKTMRSPSMFAFVVWHAARSNDPHTFAMSLSFVDAVRTGVGLGPRNPAKLLRDRLFGTSIGRGGNAFHLDSGCIIKAWNAYLECREMNMLRMLSTEPMPEIMPTIVAAER